MSAELRRDHGCVVEHNAISLPTQRAPHLTTRPNPDRSRWRRRYTSAAVAVDLAAVVASAALYAACGRASDASVVAVGVVVVALTGAALRVARAWDPVVLGQG